MRPALKLFIPKDASFMKIDCHVHSRERSACGVDGDEDMVRAAIGYGLDGLVFTDHGKYISHKRVEELNKKFNPFCVFRGIEVNTREKEEFVVLGFYEPALEKSDWKYQDLHTLVRERRGFISLAHPFRYRKDLKFDITAYPPDAIECSFSVSSRDRAKEQLKITGAHPIVASDGHCVAHVGRYYINLHGAPKNEAELAAFLKKGDYDLCGDPVRLEVQNAGIREEERVIREMLAEGRDRKYYERVVKKGAGFLFDTLQRGDSFLKPIFPGAKERRD